MKIVFIDQGGKRHPVKRIDFADNIIGTESTTGNVVAITCVDGIQFEGGEIWGAGCDLVIKP